ncbi:DUF5615 family PIN-like protein [bacterium]|nr:DUF5615 family PIN-like protein [bacterium]
MKFIVDECTGPAVSTWLRSLNYDTYSIFDSSRGISDDEVLTIANRENRIIITNDKDFGEKIYRERKKHKGVIFLRLADERSENKIKVLQNVLDGHAGQLHDQFIVVTEKRIRFAKN